MPAPKVHDHKGEANEGKPFEPTRVTVNLVPKTSHALKVEQRISGDNQTDIINRAVQVYVFFAKVLREEGTQLQIKRGDEVTELMII